MLVHGNHTLGLKMGQSQEQPYVFDSGNVFRGINSKSQDLRSQQSCLFLFISAWMLNTAQRMKFDQ